MFRDIVIFIQRGFFFFFFKLDFMDKGTQLSLGSFDTFSNISGIWDTVDTLVCDAYGQILSSIEYSYLSQ